MRTHLLFVIPAIMVITWTASCKKNNTSPTTAYIAAVAIVGSTGDTEETYRILYNMQGQVDSIIQTSAGYTQVSRFVYGNLSYTITLTTSVGAETSTLTTNADGTISSLVEQPSDTIFLSYSSSGVVQAKDDYGSQTYITGFIWVNGDIVSTYSNLISSESGYYYYDLGHLWQMGDAISIDDFLAYGRPIIKSKHLMTGRKTGTDLQKYVYKFDSKSRITQLQMPGGAETYYYTYTN